MEVWKDIKGFEGLYQVSNQGVVRSLDRVNCYGRTVKGLTRKMVKNKNGYLYVSLRKNGVAKNYSVHRLVADAFIPNPHNYHTVNHKNENKADNNVENLEWMTLQDNLKHGTHYQRARLNRKGKCCGPDHPNYGKRGKSAATHKGKVIGIKKNNPDETVMFDTAADAARALKLSSGQICESIHNAKLSCGGYYWRRVDE